MPLAAATGLMGLLLGSFLNVVSYRLPRGESLAVPASHCPSCETPIRPYDNVPLVSWLLLRGRCRHCGTRISARYPAVELTTALLYVLVALLREGTADVVLGLVLVTFLVPITLIDLETRRIPNVLNGSMAVLGLVAVLAFAPSELLEHLAAGAGGFLFFFLAVLAYPRGMGMGDVKLAGAMGLCLGRAVAPAIFFALISGVLVSAVIMARLGPRAARKTKIPFGPFLAFGGLLAMIVGDSLVDAYVDHL